MSVVVVKQESGYVFAGAGAVRFSMMGVAAKGGFRVRTPVSGVSVRVAEVDSLTEQLLRRTVLTWTVSLTVLTLRLALTLSASSACSKVSASWKL